MSTEVIDLGSSDDEREPESKKVPLSISSMPFGVITKHVLKMFQFWLLLDRKQVLMTPLRAGLVLHEQDGHANSRDTITGCAMATINCDLFVFEMGMEL